MVEAAFVRPTATSPPLAFLRGAAAPAAQDLVVVDVGGFGDGRGSGGTAAPAARDLVVFDACVVRLLFEGLGLTSALDGRGRLRAADGHLSAPHLLAGGEGARRSKPRHRRRRQWSWEWWDRGARRSRPRRCPPLAFLRWTAAPAAQDLVVVDACVLRLLFEGLSLTSALDGRGLLRAADGRLSAHRLLAGDNGAH